MSFAEDLDDENEVEEFPVRITRRAFEIGEDELSGSYITRGDECQGIEMESLEDYLRSDGRPLEED